ncbi:unnamed protein product [Vitrella brassicaformis CCMP3155]|uniref:Uncharacterized protein n=1 Tax=Vitrella brassicaformis (strain CCMP3155) TaxID=1169540 RepID=A0A0G4EQY0_VITBC|nr:unnamed protein product [Vitrella brassicaformis CCMP3155]|eukprot:CEL99976.1 unnamed protein product [Vitrella brassicaformis CCMP3155]
MAWLFSPEQSLMLLFTGDVLYNVYFEALTKITGSAFLAAGILLYMYQEGLWASRIISLGFAWATVNAVLMLYYYAHLTPLAIAGAMWSILSGLYLALI